MDNVIRKEYVLALKELVGFVKQHPEDKSTWNKIGQICWELGDRETAETAFKKSWDDERHRVEVVGVPQSEQKYELLLGYAIDTPVPGRQVEVSAINVSGWVMGKKSSAVAVEIVYEDKVIQRSPVYIPRQDVPKQYPETPWAENCGFRVMVGVLGMPSKFEFLLQAVLKDGEQVPLGKVRVRRRLLQSNFQPTLRPLMITAYGRTGTTWLMRVLAEHPNIVVDRRYPYEARVSSYCMFIFNILLTPANVFQCASPGGTLPLNLLISKIRHPSLIRPNVSDYRINHWFERIYAEQAVAFCQGIIESFYRQLAISQGQIRAVYFAEKYMPGLISDQLWELYPNTREIILVRDFRDMVCSVLAFNKKRKFEDFGRQYFTSDAEYIKQQVREDAQCLLNNWKKRFNRTYLLRYEDMVLRPEKTLKAVLEYLNLDSSLSIIKGMFQRSSEDTSELKRHRTIGDPRTSIGRWRSDLSAEMQALCVETFGDIMKEFGYSLGETVYE